MNVHVSSHPLVKHKLTILRNEKTEHKKFRELIREIAMILGYEAMADLGLYEVDVKTPIQVAKGFHLEEEVGLVPILRAGLGMVDGIHEMIPGAQVWHLGFYRDERTLRPVAYYNKLPIDPTVQLCLILDPMLATGGSAVAAVDVLKKWGVRRIKFVGLIAAPEGLEAMTKAHPDIAIHLAAIDDHLNERGFIVPGLGDAGDRQFGTA
ncbi:MAG TPA: uracil phosphoribosyltransferase [Aggregatilineaceae bacterium]|nr:uracil phosphoribosyltransferase [Aggregatilineaceae bacterium]